ncbi:MAG TPA: prolipoprotein diacylglyceryl transferase family protein, partial [Candidatus Bathyarchaeia archaeon]|nr:prolipoprotein diacylglyceryl transferase family protein [Candidatus Bathyarchaeia archaeon]
GFSWGVDFGDHILRHPTQLYEAVFCLGLFFFLKKEEGKFPKDGMLFAYFLFAYFAFRFFEEFLRAGSPLYVGLTSFQWVSGLLLFYVFYTRMRRTNLA